MARNIFSVPRSDDQVVVRDESWKSTLVRGAWTLAPKDAFITKANKELADKYDCTHAAHIGQLDLPFRGESEGAEDDVLVLSIARGSERPTSAFFKPLDELLPLKELQDRWKDFVLRRDCMTTEADLKKLRESFAKVTKA
jgi:hypothetical protein